MNKKYSHANSAVQGFTLEVLVTSIAVLAFLFFIQTERSIKFVLIDKCYDQNSRNVCNFHTLEVVVRS